MSPQIIFLISGKRKSGKDYVSEQLLSRVGSEATVIIRLSAPIKLYFAEQYGLDYRKLLDDSDYKETYRQRMIEWGESMRAEDRGYFCRRALEMSKADQFSVWIVSDTRRRSDIAWFRQEYCQCVRTVRVHASLDARVKRGFVFTPGIDDAESECDLDSVDSWDLVVNNDSTTDSCHSIDSAFDKMISWIT